MIEKLTFKGENLLPRIIVILWCYSITSFLLAHPGHDDSRQLDQKSAIAVAAKKLEDLVEADKLEAFWLGKEVATAQLARVKGRQNWIVSYVDDGGTMRVEFIFSLMGNFITFSKRTLSDTDTIQ